MITRVKIENGAAVNILPMFMFKALGKPENYFIPSDVSVCGLAGNTAQTKGILPVEYKVGSLNQCTAFFVIERTSSWNALLGRDWLHSNGCVPSTLLFYSFLI